ncbi:MAG: hypothetical protein AAFV53_17725 [Myxococcota bacterium]
MKIRALTLLTGLVVSGCSRDDLYAESTFTENVAEAYAECNASEIRFLASKHNIQTAFRNCGSNNFSDVAWSPDGVWLHFRTANNSAVLNAEDKTIGALPTEPPTADAAWLNKELVAMPLGPKEGGDTPRLALYNLAGLNLNVVNLPLEDVQDLQPWGDGEQLLMVAVGADGVKRPYRFNPSTETAERAFGFLEQPVERLVYSPEADLLAWSTAESTELMQGDGTSILVLPGITRAIPHHEGRYVMLETTGEAISPFDQRAWNEISDEARERELVRQKQFVERLPDWAPREYHPPELQILDLQEKARYRLTSFHGDHFEWYRSSNPMARYYGSFILWGIEGKQLHRNVGLSDFAERLRMLNKGETPLGIERMESVSIESLGAPVASPEIPSAGNPDE